MKSGTLMKLVVVVLAVGLLIQLSSERQSSQAAVNRELELQTVPTRTPIPEPTEPPPPTNTPAQPPPTNTPVPPPPKDTPVPPPSTSAPTPTAEPALVVANADTEVYSGAGPDHNVVGSLKAGDTAPVVGRNAEGSWWQIVFQGSTAWVPDAVVTANPAAYNVPVAAASAATDSSPTILPTAGGGSWLLAGGAPLLISGVLLMLAGLQVHRRDR
jgi:uncharacterized protein YgiM (DUF1202 family)